MYLLSVIGLKNELIGYRHYRGKNFNELPKLKFFIKDIEYKFYENKFEDLGNNFYNVHTRFKSNDGYHAIEIITKVYHFTETDIIKIEYIIDVQKYF
jgi:hypothetical protein